MLRVTRMAENESRVILLVEGQIRPPWAAELEREVLTCRRAGQDVVMDFAGVTYVSGDCVNTLRRLQSEGAQLTHCSRILEELLR